MPLIKITDEEFLQLWREHGSARKIAKITGMDERNIYRRRDRLEEKIDAPLYNIKERAVVREHPARKLLGIENGCVIVFSDAHFWPGNRSTAFDGLLHLIKELQPKAVICNGDAFDAATISRHPRIGFTHSPSLVEELKSCKTQLGEVEEAAKAARHNVKLVWPLGNHDARFETFLAANAPQYEQVQGFSLRDHFPDWEPCWSCWPTETLVVKHRWKGGAHATYNNTLGSGVSMVTGHLHQLKWTPYTDYNGVRYGVDSGTLAEVEGPQFYNYTEDAPLNWGSGFAVLTLFKGQLLQPELARKWDNEHIEFRGQIIKVR